MPFVCSSHMHFSITSQKAQWTQHRNIHLWNLVTQLLVIGWQCEATQLHIHDFTADILKPQWFESHSSGIFKKRKKKKMTLQYSCQCFTFYDKSNTGNCYPVLVVVIMCNSLTVKTSLPYLQIGLIVMNSSCCVTAFTWQLVTIKSLEMSSPSEKLILHS